MNRTRIIRGMGVCLFRAVLAVQIILIIVFVVNLVMCFRLDISAKQRHYTIQSDSGVIILDTYWHYNNQYYTQRVGQGRRWQLSYQWKPSFEVITRRFTFRHWYTDSVVKWKYDWWAKWFPERLFIEVESWLLPAILLPFTTLLWHRKFKRDRSRVRESQGLCVGCGYDLAGRDANLPCPECGARRSTQPDRAAS
jgi:hypothetical protein